MKHCKHGRINEVNIMKHCKRCRLKARIGLYCYPHFIWEMGKSPSSWVISPLDLKVLRTHAHRVLRGEPR